MKKPKRIKIVADRPAKGQDSIADWIGCEFDVIAWDKETRIVDVNDEDKGHCVIQPAEYEVVN